MSSGKTSFFLSWLQQMGAVKWHRREHRAGSPLSSSTGLKVLSYGSWNFWCNIKHGQGEIQVALLCLFSILPD